MLSALEAAPAPDYSTTLNDQSRPLRERLAEFGRAVAAEEPGDTEELAVYLEFFAALLRAPDALQRYSSGRERRLQELADADRPIVMSSPRGSRPSRPGPSGRRCWSACRSTSAWPPASSRRRCSSARSACWPTSTRSSKDGAQLPGRGLRRRHPAVSLVTSHASPFLTQSRPLLAVRRRSLPKTITSWLTRGGPVRNPFPYPSDSCTGCAGEGRTSARRRPAKKPRLLSERGPLRPLAGPFIRRSAACLADCGLMAAVWQAVWVTVHDASASSPHGRHRYEEAVQRAAGSAAAQPAGRPCGPVSDLTHDRP